jgi:gamma-glutamyltranspeptidase/glutathione hydrolase
MAFGVSKIRTSSTEYGPAHRTFPVSEDLVRYMKAASVDNNTFLVDDPTWAEDFAPNGQCSAGLEIPACTVSVAYANISGTLVQLGDIITRKRYAK